MSRRAPSDLSRSLTIVVGGLALAATVAMFASRLLLPSDALLIPTETWPWTHDGVAVRPLVGGSPIRDGDVVVAIDDRPLADWVTDAIAPPWFLGGRPLGPSLDVTVARESGPVDVPLPLDDTFASRISGAPIALVAFGAGALVIALTLLVRRPQATAIRLLFVGVCCNTADLVAWETGLQPSDLVGRTPFLYGFALASLASLVFWACLLHLLSIYPVRAGWLARRPARVRWIHAAPFVALAVGAIGARLIGGSVLDWLDRLGTLIALIVSVMGVAILGSIVAAYRRTPVPRRPQVRLLAATLGIAAAASVGLTSVPIVLFDHPILPRAAVALFAIPVIGALALAILRDRLFQVDLLVTSRRRIIAAREEERLRLRRELHDGLGPTLAALGLKVDRARADAASDPAALGPLLDEIRSDLRAVLTQIRTLSRELRPPGLDALGLVDTLRQQLATIGGAGGPVITIEAAELGPLPPAVEVAAYRIVIEAVTNVVRHAGAAVCTVRLARDREALTVSVSDDGSGIGTGRGAVGVGTRAMYERAAEIGGELTIEAGAGAGTIVTAWLPVAAADTVAGAFDGSAPVPSPAAPTLGDRPGPEPVAGS